MTHIEYLTRDEVIRRRQAALDVLGITLEQWRDTAAGFDCLCCFGEEMRERFVYPEPDYSTGMARMAALDEINSMTYLLREEP